MGFCDGWGFEPAAFLLWQEGHPHCRNGRKPQGGGGGGGIFIYWGGEGDLAARLLALSSHAHTGDCALVALLPVGQEAGTATLCPLRCLPACLLGPALRPDSWALHHKPFSTCFISEGSRAGCCLPLSHLLSPPQEEFLPPSFALSSPLSCSVSLSLSTLHCDQDPSPAGIRPACLVLPCLCPPKCGSRLSLEACLGGGCPMVAWLPSPCKQEGCCCGSPGLPFCLLGPGGRELALVPVLEVPGSEH